MKRLVGDPTFYGLCTSAAATENAAKLPFYYCGRVETSFLCTTMPAAKQLSGKQAGPKGSLVQELLKEKLINLAGSRTHPLSTRPVCVRPMTRGLQSNGA